MPVLFDNYYFVVLLVSNSVVVNIVFHESLLLRKQKQLSQKFDNVQSEPLSSQWNKGEKAHKFFSSHTSFWCLKKMKPFWGTTKNCENKNYHFLFQLIILQCFGQDRLTKFFLIGFSYLKNGIKHKTCFSKSTVQLALWLKSGVDLKGSA